MTLGELTTFCKLCGKLFSRFEPNKKDKPYFQEGYCRDCLRHKRHFKELTKNPENNIDGWATL